MRQTRTRSAGFDFALRYNRGMDYAGRMDCLRMAMQKSKTDSLLVTHMPNVRYLTGFTGSAGVVLVTSRSALFFTDGRYVEQAAQEVVGAKVHAPTSPALIAAARRACRVQSGGIGIEADHMVVAMQRRLAQLLPKRIRLKPTSGLVETLRAVKERDEIELLRRANELGAKLLPVAFRAIKPGVSEASVAAEIEYTARKRGAQGMSFDTIVASGPRSALPHGVAREAPIPAKGFVVLDFGVILHGYCSDMTRTVHVGRPAADDRALYQAVLEAQLAGIEACRPGTTMAEVDASTRNVLKRAKLDQYFTHSTGHGVGLEIHEQPRLAHGQNQILQPGMVVTIEPGIYLAGRCGIRIEDVVAVTETGHELLTPAKKEWMEV